MATVKVKVLGHPFRDSKAKNVKRRPNETFECDEARAKELIKGGWVEKAELSMRRGKAKEEAKKQREAEAKDEKK